MGHSSWTRSLWTPEVSLTSFPVVNGCPTRTREPVVDDFLCYFITQFKTEGNYDPVVSFGTLVSPRRSVLGVVTPVPDSGPDVVEMEKWTYLKTTPVQLLVWFGRGISPLFFVFGYWIDLPGFHLSLSLRFYLSCPWVTLSPGPPSSTELKILYSHYISTSPLSFFFWGTLIRDSICFLILHSQYQLRIQSPSLPVHVLDRL